MVDAGKESVPELCRPRRVPGAHHQGEGPFWMSFASYVARDVAQQQTGRLPASFSELEVAGMLRGTPRDPLGQTYKLMPDGSVELRTPDDFPFIEKGTSPGYVPPPSPKILPSD